MPTATAPVPPPPRHKRLPLRAITIPTGTNAAALTIGNKTVQLTNLNKPFWPELNLTKRDLIQYYADVSSVLLPHLQRRAMVMKRYPNGVQPPENPFFFFMKRAPSPRPPWIEICNIEHDSGNIINFPVINDLPSLLWVVNLGCIDLNPWYSRCDDVNRPDIMNFDLDPVKAKAGEKEVPFDRVLEVALIVRDALKGFGITSYAKTTGSRGIHVYVPIVRGPTQKEVWTFAKALAQMLAKRHPDCITAEYRIAKRPKDRVLVDYNQNAWGRTLASLYSVRPRAGAPVSVPVTWKEVERGVTIEQFHLRNVPKRVAKLGDLWKPLTLQRGRCNVEKVLRTLKAEH